MPVCAGWSELLILPVQVRARLIVRFHHEAGATWEEFRRGSVNHQARVDAHIARLRQFARMRVVESVHSALFRVVDFVDVARVDSNVLQNVSFEFKHAKTRVPHVRIRVHRLASVARVKNNKYVRREIVCSKRSTSARRSIRAKERFQV